LTIIYDEKKKEKIRWEMKKVFLANSFKRKLMVALMSVGLVPLIIISILYQNILNNRIVKDTNAASIEKLKYLSMNIERQIDAAEQLLGWITYNQRLEQILKKSYDQVYEKQMDIIEFSSYTMEYAINANVENKIFKILIMNEDGSSFQMGNGYSLLREADIMEAGWMETFQRRKADELILSMDRYAKDTFVFPMSSRIYDNLTGKPIGWCLLIFQNNMYSDYLLAGTEENGQEHLFIINGSGQCIAHTDKNLLGTDMSDVSMVHEILQSGQETGHVTGIYDGEAMILHYYQIPNTNMIEIQGTSLEAFLQEKRSMTRLLALLIITTVMAILLVILYLSNMLMRPINTISEYIKKVPGSGFKGNMVLKGDDEFKKIAISINNMEREILQLMEREKQEEEVKKKLEFKVLQNQINPHFLYNTLNSIKWIASLQHADTIRDMTSALGRLLQNISKGTDSKIPIYEEMSLLDDYILIQDIRYSGKIQVEYHIGNSEITQAYIVKFLLQPIVENAIFHGIEPKDSGGRIDIYLDRVEDDIHISIVDDGIGMTKEQIASLLYPEEAGKNVRGLSGIGVSNIRERIIMTYGKEYGIEITSRMGEYTRVMIKIPYEREG